MANMATEKASVAHAKNILSSLINKVADGKTRVVLESRGKPKAALISTEDTWKNSSAWKTVPPPRSAL